MISVAFQEAKEEERQGGRECEMRDMDTIERTSHLDSALTQIR